MGQCQTQCWNVAAEADDFQQELRHVPVLGALKDPQQQVRVVMAARTPSPSTDASVSTVEALNDDDDDAAEWPRAGTLNAVACVHEIRHLCQQCRVIEAAGALAVLEQYAAAASANQDNIDNVSTLLAGDAMLNKLRAVHGRLARYFRPDGLLAAALRGCVDQWSTAEVYNKRIGERFRVAVSSRHLEGAERDENGLATQMVIKISIADWPQKLPDFVAMDREVDLITKAVIKDCKSYEGEVGSVEQLLSAKLHYIIRPALFPASLEFLQIREYAVCREPPIPGYPAGVFVTEETPPCCGEFEGWRIPSEKFGVKRLFQKSVKVFTPSKEDPNCSTQTIFMKVEVPLMQRLVPLGLFNKIVLSTTQLTFENYKREIVDKWEESGLKARTKGSPDFYEAVASIGNLMDEQADLSI